MNSKTNYWNPVRRVGPKGSGKWERISWDDTLDTIAEKILYYKEKFGAESIVPGYGTGRENEAAIYRHALSRLFPHRKPPDILAS